MRSGSQRVAAGVVGTVSCACSWPAGCCRVGSMVQAQGQATGACGPGVRGAGCVGRGAGAACENPPARATDTDACRRYPGWILRVRGCTSACDAIGARSPAGRLFEPALGVQALPLHAPVVRPGCTDAGAGGAPLAGHVERAKPGTLAATPQASVLGQPVPPDPASCVGVTPLSCAAAAASRAPGRRRPLGAHRGIGAGGARGAGSGPLPVYRPPGGRGCR